LQPLKLSASTPTAWRLPARNGRRWSRPGTWILDLQTAVDERVAQLLGLATRLASEPRSAPD
jgi:hypothetical protein